MYSLFVINGKFSFMAEVHTRSSPERAAVLNADRVIGGRLY